MKQLDVAIIGAGPIGLSVGIAMEKAGLEYCIFDKGCLVHSLYNFPDKMTFFSTSRLLEIGGVPFISHSEKPTRDESLEYYRRVVGHWRLKLSLYNPVNAIKGIDGHFTLNTQEGPFRTRKIVLSTGFYDRPRLMNVPGEELSKVRHYYKNAHPYFGKKVLVVGAANSACDVALELWRTGAEVTMAIRGDAISPRVKYWIRPNIENRIKEGSIKAYFQTEVMSIHPDSVILKNDSGEFSLPNDFVLAMTGYVPDLEFLRSCGIAVDADPDKIPECSDNSRETNVPGIYLAGVICGGLLTSKYFIENSRHHGDLIAEDILNKQK
ncbi:MAG: YpdA family putative bacillithiol disulfide reductase [Saprospirales bacterium]|nr:MAG: YpdA family putative bacillithiol disulfide reductase [Saprospirales bacterium]